MTREEIVQHTESLMKTTDLWASDYRGIAVGPIIATVCSMAAIKHWSDREGSNLSDNDKRGKPSRIRHNLVRNHQAWARSLMSMVQFIGTSIKRYDALFVGMTTDRYLHENEQVDVFLHPLKEWSDRNRLRTLHIEDAPAGELRLPHSDNSVEIEFGKFVLSIIFGIMNRVQVNRAVLDANAIEFLRHFSKITSMPYRYLKRISVGAISSTYLWHKVWHAILTILKPSSTFVVTYYRPFGWGLCAASRRLGASCVDLQHGVQGPYHPAYGSFSEPAGRVAGLTPLPTHYWVWSETEKQATESWSNDIAKVVIGGNPWLAQILNEQCAEVENENKVHTDFTLSLLCTLQPGFPLPDWFQHVIGVKKDWLFVMRLHPGMRNQTKSIKRFFRRYPNVIVDDGARHVLSALQGITLHVTKHSTTVLEAKALGIRSIILGRDPGGAIYRSEIQQGYAAIAENPDQFMNLVDVLSDEPTAHATESIISRLDQAMDFICHESRRYA